MNRRLKPAAFLALALAITIIFTGCSSGKNNSSKASESSLSQTKKTGEMLKTFSLPYTTTENFNPLSPASNANMVLWPLIYDCLCEPDANFNPVMRLAESVNSSGTTATIKLKSGVQFTDGSPLTAADVVYTFNAVRSNANSPYYSRLANVSEVKGNGNTVTLTLITPDPLIANMLDIPIIKADSDKNGNAIGTGRYKYSKSGTNAVLTKNPKWYNGNSSKFNKISLVNIPYSDAIMTSLAIGEINFVYSDDGTNSAASVPNTDTSPVNLNQLIYVGINAGKPHLSNAHFRRALSFSISRELLVSQNYSNRAYPSAYPFNPKWSEISKIPQKLSSDFDAVAAEMQQAGNTSGITLTLLVNQENPVRNNVAKYLASCFNKTGINVTVKSVPYEEYESLIKSGNFDMYLGEVRLSNNMDISPLLAAGGTAAFSTVPNSSTLSAFNDWRNGYKDIAYVADTFEAEMPFIPLCYRTGLTSYTKGLTGVQSMDNDVFFNFEKWK